MKIYYSYDSGTIKVWFGDYTGDPDRTKSREHGKPVVTPPEAYDLCYEEFQSRLSTKDIKGAVSVMAGAAFRQFKEK